MTEIYFKELEKYEFKPTSREKVIRYLKFYLIPGRRDPQFSAIEYEIDKTKSRRKLFRRLLTPLTITGILMILFIAVLAMYAPWITEYTIEEITPPNYPGEPAFAPPSPGHPLGTTKLTFFKL